MVFKLKSELEQALEKEIVKVVLHKWLYDEIVKVTYTQNMGHIHTS